MSAYRTSAAPPGIPWRRAVVAALCPWSRAARAWAGGWWRYDRASDAETRAAQSMAAYKDAHVERWRAVPRG